jgi:MFS family permease
VWALAGPPTALPLLIAVAVLFGAGYGTWLSLGPAMLAATTDPRRLGRALGTYSTAVGIGGVIGPVLATPVLASTPTLLLGTCVIVALGAAVLLVCRRTAPTPRPRS